MASLASARRWRSTHSRAQACAQKARFGTNALYDGSIEPDDITGTLDLRASCIIGSIRDVARIGTAMKLRIQNTI